MMSHAPVILCFFSPLCYFRPQNGCSEIKIKFVATLTLLHLSQPSQRRVYFTIDESRAAQLSTICAHHATSPAPTKNAQLGLILINFEKKRKKRKRGQTFS